MLFNPFTVRPGLEQHPYFFVCYIWFYFATAICCFVRTWKSAWWLAIILPLGPFIYMSEFVVGNLWLVITWQKPYRDNPLLLLPALVIFALTVAPGIAVYYFLYRDLRTLRQTLFKKVTTTSVERDQ